MFKEERKRILLTEDDFESIDESDSEYLNSKGEDYYRKGSYEKARAYFELSTTLGDTNAPTNLGYMYLYGKDTTVRLIAFTSEQLDAKGRIFKVKHLLNEQLEKLDEHVRPNPHDKEKYIHIEHNPPNSKDNGLIGCISKGCRNLKSKLRLVSENFAYGTFHLYYKENGLSTLIDGDITDYFINIRSESFD